MTITLIAVMSAAFVYYVSKNEQRIIDFAIQEINKNVTTPIEVRTIELDYLSGFPTILLEFNDVNIHSSNANSVGQLLVAEKIHLSLDLLSLVQGDLTINGIYLQKGKLAMNRDKSGTVNYQVISTGNQQGKGFEIKKLQMEDIQFEYDDQLEDVKVTTEVEKADGIVLASQNLDFVVDGVFLKSNVTAKGNDFLRSKTLAIKSVFTLFQASKKITFKPSVIGLHQGAFEFQGEIDYAEKTKVDLNITAKDADIQTFISLFPDHFAERFSSFKSKGTLYFNGRMQGMFSKEKGPSIQFNFGSSEASIFIPNLNHRIKSLTSTGTIQTTDLFRPDKFHLQLTEFSCSLLDHQLSGELNLSDFSSPEIEMDVDGTIPVGMLATLNDETISSGSGLLTIDANVDLKVQNSDDARVVVVQHGAGEIALNDVYLSAAKSNLNFKKLNGNINLSGKDLALSEISGQLNSSEFSINGFVTSFNHWFESDQKLSITADANFTNLNLTELIRLISNESSSIEESNSGISSNSNFDVLDDLNLDINCSAKHVSFNRFNGQDISGRLVLDNRIFNFQDIYLEGIGGKSKFSGSISAKNKERYEVSVDAEFQDLLLDSLFYVFKNFKQDFLVEKNLRGRASATVSSFFNLNDSLNLVSPSLFADVNLKIRDGELLNFEPLQILSKYVDSRSLEQLRFSEVSNNILIENETVHLPKMTIYNNISDLTVEGTHTFDQKIDYRISIPLKKILKLKKIKAGDIDQKVAGSRIYLQIYGTADHYLVEMDKVALKDKLKEDFSGEKEEFLESFKKSEDDNTLELEDEFFEFEEADTLQY